MPSSFLSICFALAYSGFRFSVADCRKILHREDPSEAFCPLNFHFLGNLLNEGAPGPVFLDMPRQCQYALEAISLVRSEYLRTNGRFLPPSTDSKACWESYMSLIGQHFRGFDIQTACGYHPEWISMGCKDITSLAEFESLIPESKLREIKCFCNQSLDNSAACELCTKSLSSVGESYLQLQGPDIGNVTDCSGYPFMHAAAMVNKFGNTATAKCLFSLEFSLRVSNTKRYAIVLSGALTGCLVGFSGASSAVLLLWMGREHCKREKITNFAEDETGLILTNLVKFRYEDIKKATMNFSRENLIGKGGYGNVYKGVLPDGSHSQVAFERFKNCSASAAGDATFSHEVEVIASVRHVNLVSLKGYCTTTVPQVGHQRIIVCDFMPNGSLYDHLFGPEMKKLSWPVRLKISLGTARGLAYLHYGAQPAIIHRDVKASNILLDENFEPKLADFGLARFNYAEEMTHLSTKVAGTLGYVAPEYALYGILTERSDVYSFGVVLLELLSGRKAFETEEGQASRSTDWAWSLMQKGRALDVIEEDVPEWGSNQVMEHHVVVAVLCSHPILHARRPREVAQSIGITFNEAEVTSSNPPLPSYVDMSKKKKKKKKKILHARPTMDQVVKMLEAHSYNWSLSLGPLVKDSRQLSIQTVSNLDQ